MTRVFDACPAYEAQKDARQAEKRAFLKGGEVGEVLRNVQQRLPGVELTNDDVAALYVLCGFEVSHFNTTTSVCSLFEEEDMETLAMLRREVVKTETRYRERHAVLYDVDYDSDEEVNESIYY